MFALIIYQRVLLFDSVNHYGIYDLETVNLNGYLILTNYKEIITYYYAKYFCIEELKHLEQYSDFLYHVCLKYLKDFYYL